MSTGTQVRFVFGLLLLLGVSSQKNSDDDEGRPYEFSFTIDGEQHRYEKKDVHGIIQGEFGFITADGVYHVTVYATDENGSFKILSMRNVKISEPLDKGGKPTTAGKFGPTAGKQAITSSAGAPPPSPVLPAAPPQLKPQPPPTRAPLYDFTTASTIANGCSGCGIVTKPPPGALPFQNPAFRKIDPPSNGNGAPKGLISKPFAPAGQPSVSDPSFPSPPVPLPQPQGPGPQFPNSQVKPGQVALPQSPNFASKSSAGGVSLPQGPAPISGPPHVPELNLLAPGPSPGPPGTDTSLEPNPFGPAPAGPSAQPFAPQLSQPSPSSQPAQPPQPQQPPQNSAQPAGPISGAPPQTPSSTGFDNQIPSKPNAAPSKVQVKDGVIEIPGNMVKITDKYPNMVDGLPNGVTEGDIQDLLYKFNYTVGFHGHYEKGLKNGAKIGGYFVNGRDGYSRVVTYVADENGYKPKFSLIHLGLDSEDTPKPDSEKKFGLKSFEFIWYPAN